MSLLRTIAIKAPRAPLAATATKRVRFSTSPYARKDSTSAVKETVESVNKKVGDAAVKGIEKGQQATSTLKSTVGINASKAEGSAREITGDAKDKGSELAGRAREITGDAKGKGSELAGKAEGSASEITGDAKGNWSELAGEAKGKAQEVAGQAKGRAEAVKGKT